MGIPNGAKLEKVLSKDVVLYDVVDLLPKHDVKSYRTRTEEITHLIAHKSGGDGADGFRGLLGSVRYVVRYKKTRSKPNGYPGSTYTFWLPRVPDRDSSDRMVIYRAQHDDVVSWHTGGGMNACGISACFQGNYDGDDDGIIARGPTKEQWVMAEALLGYVTSRYGIDVTGYDDERGWYLTGHWEHGKPVCPGDAIKEWVIRTRTKGLALPLCPSAPARDEVDPFNFTARERQKALLLLGFDPGPVDGLWGPLSRAGLEAFQEAFGLTPDGWLGKQTAAVMLEALRARGLSARDAFHGHA